MKQKFLAVALSIRLIGVTLPAPARANDGLGDAHKIKHVLLISVDGLHALDVARFVESYPNSALAELSRHGITYSNARTPANTDSFPGLLALVTGGSPISHGMFYDVSYELPPGFYGGSYDDPRGHITPIAQWQMRWMLKEVGFDEVDKGHNSHGVRMIIDRGKYNLLKGGIALALGPLMKGDLDGDITIWLVRKRT